MKNTEEVSGEELQKLLMEFIKRATKAEATPEEIAALPGVASVLAKTIFAAF